MNVIAFVAIGALAVACSFDGEPPLPPGDSEPEPQYLSVSGTVFDFETGLAVDAATLDPRGLTRHTTTLNGSDYTVDDVLAFSFFHAAVTAPTYRETINVATKVEDTDIVDRDQFAVTETFAQALESEFSSGGGSIVLAELVDGNGDPFSGFPGSALGAIAGVTQLFFLDAGMVPDSDLLESSESGWAVLLNADEGLIKLEARAESGYTLAMGNAPVSSTAVTIVRVEVTVGDVPVLPSNVSFEDDLKPLFQRNGCTTCHKGNGDGVNIGDLSLQGGPAYADITQEISPRSGVTRVDLDNPANSLLLTKPLIEDPPDGHQQVFQSTDELDYQLILVWISEGAQDN